MTAYFVYMHGMFVHSRRSDYKLGFIGPIV